jgi:VanZ family protein
MIKNILLFQFPWLFMMLAIYIQSSISSLKIPDFGFDLEDKILHFLIFGILGILTARGLKKSNFRIVKENYILITLITCIIYGASDEIHQYFVPGRYSSWWDWIADILGIITLVWIYKRFIDSSEKKNKKLNGNRSVI